MRADSAAFKKKNDALHKAPRYIVEMQFSDANDDPIYFTSSPDCDLPTTATSSNTFHNTIKSVIGTNQKLEPIKGKSTIGDGSFKIVDVANAVSEYLRDKWIDDKALRSRRVRTWVGYDELDFSLDYAMIGTQNKYNHTYDGITYVFETEDLQRSVKKDIFDQNKTTLVESVTDTQLAVPVNDTADFELNWHDTNYTDAPSTSIGYILLEENKNKEVISWTGRLQAAVTISGTDLSFAAGDSSLNSTSTSLSGYAAGQLITVSGSSANSRSFIINTVAASKITLLDLDGTAVAVTTEAAGPTIGVNAPIQFYNCTRAKLNTRANAYTVDTSKTVDQRTKVTEHIYIETTLPRIVYGLLTGVWYGTANTLPTDWHLGIDTSLINSASFIDKLDLYNPADDSGKVFKFSGLKKIDAKKFIAEQCCLPMACYLRVLNDGDLALRRFQRVLSDSSYVSVLDASNIRDFSAIRNDDSQVHNVFQIDWNYEFEKESTTRSHVLVDSASVTKHGRADPLTFEFLGLHGSRHTLQTLHESFNMLRDRHAGPPQLLSVTCHHRMNALEIGDIVRVTLDNVYDITNENTTTVDRSFEIQGKTVNWITGEVKLDLFGSSEPAGALSSVTVSTVMSDDFYNTAGGELSAGKKLDSVLTTSLVGSVLHITASGTLTGEANTSINSRYWYDGDVTIDAGVTVTFTNNIEIRVKGHFTNNGTLTGASGGMTAGNSGVLGVTRSGGAIHFDYNSGGHSHLFGQLIQGTQIQGTYESLPFFAVQPDAAGDTLSGVPTDLRGSGGPTGATTTYQDTAYTGTVTGGTGGAGGGGCVIISRGVTCGANGKFNSSGADGTAGGESTSSDEFFTANTKLRAGAGGGGAPGGFLFLLDGNDATHSLSNSNFVQDQGDCPRIGTRVPYVIGRTTTPNWIGTFHAWDEGFAASSLNASNWRIQFIPGTTAAEADQADIADVVTAVTPTETQNSPSTVAQNLSTVQIDVTAPADGNYQYSNVYYKLSSQPDEAYTYVGPAKDSITLPPTVMDGSTYDVIARPVSKKGIESTEYTHTTVTVSTASGGAVMGNGNYIKIGQTAYNTGTGAWIEKIASGVKASFGSATKKLLIDTDAASVVEIIGKATIDEGTIGGATISATQLYNGTNIIIDWSSKYFAINSATFGASGIQAQYNAGSPRFYVGNGMDKYFQFTTASGVETGAGTLKEYTIEMYTTGVVKSDSDPSTNGGFQLDINGLRLWDGSGNLNVDLDTTAAKLILGGQSNIELDSLTGAISINDSTFGNSGIQFQYNSAAPQMYVGNGIDNFIKYTNSAGFEIGRDVKFDSGKSFLSSVIYYDGHINDHNPSTSATGSGEALALSTRIRLSTSASGDTASLELDRSNTFTTPTWSNNRRFRAKVEVLNLDSTNAQAWVQTGTAGAGGSPTTGFGFKLYNGSIYGFSNNNGATTTTAALDTYASGDELDLRADLIAGSTIKFYINGVLSGTTITTNYPTGTASASKFLNVLIQGLGTQTNRIYVGDFKVEQT